MNLIFSNAAIYTFLLETNPVFLYVNKEKFVISHPLEMWIQYEIQIHVLVGQWDALSWICRWLIKTQYPRTSAKLHEYLPLSWRTVVLYYYSISMIKSIITMSKYRIYTELDKNTYLLWTWTFVSFYMTIVCVVILYYDQTEKKKKFIQKLRSSYRSCKYRAYKLHFLLIEKYCLYETIVVK